MQTDPSCSLNSDLSVKQPLLLRSIQNEILKDPHRGAVIPGLGGLRKIRIGDVEKGRGKRGGYRVIYLDMMKSEKTYLIWIYSKNESEDMTPDEKKIIRHLVDILKKENQSYEN